MNFFSFFNYLNREVFTQDASYLPDTIKRNHIGINSSYILSNADTLSSVNGTTLLYDLPAEITDTSNWNVAIVLPFDYTLYYTGKGASAGERNISASFTNDRKVQVVIPKYATNNQNGVDDEFALILSNLKIALIYIE